MHVHPINVREHCPRWLAYSFCALLGLLCCNRFRLRGARHFVFYQLPDHAHFYAEFLNALDQGDNSCLVLFNKFDTFALERVVGSERSAKLLKSDKDVHMFC